MHFIMFALVLLLHPFITFAAFQRPQYAKRAYFEHDAVDLIHRRQMDDLSLPPEVPAETTHEPTVITYVTPSPSASSVPVTSQHQLVTSYIPQLTLCALPPLAFISGSFPNPATTGPPYLNYSVSTPSDSGTCLTSYSSTVTPICYTVLDGIASQVTVSDCTQEVTFSSEYGYDIESPSATISGSSIITPPPSIATLGTYYIAPWEEVTGHSVPEDVTMKVCTTYANFTTICMSTIEAWYVETVTTVSTSISHIDLTTTVNGPALVRVETWHVDVTETETILSLSTHMTFQYQMEALITIRGNLTASSTSFSTETSTVTRNVEYNSPETTEVSNNVPSDFFSTAEFSTSGVNDGVTFISMTTTLPGRTSTARNWNTTGL